MLRFYSLFAIIIFSISTFSQVKVSSSKSLKLEYASKPWNKNPKEIDQTAILLRDSETKKIAKVQLVESDVNSGKFIGYYSVSFGDQDLRPEVYLPPQSMVNGTENLKKLETMINDGTLLRKPFFIREEGGSANVLTVFDTKDQALIAFEKYRQQRSQVNSPVGRATMEAQAKTKKELEEKARAEFEAKQISDRERLIEEEKRKQAELLRQQQELSEAEKALRKKQADQLAAEAMKDYDKQNYKEAATKFARATELDPSNTNFHFQYGVSLYRLENYDKSIAVLKLASGDKVNQAEKNFFLGLNHMKLKEYKESQNDFSSVKASGDKQLAPPAAFYLGVLQFQGEDYENSKANFEYVLDNSEDPAMDKQSETYIEQIANIMAFKKEQAKKYILTLNAGVMYDSNILAIARSQLDQQTELAGYRWSYGLNFEYRALYGYIHDFSVMLGASDLYSTNKKFSAEKSFQDTDPLTFTIYFPYKFKGKAFNRGYQMTLNPGYETTAMNADASGSRETILNSTVLKNDHTFVMNETWFATYSIEFRQDVSKIESTNGTSDDLNATKIGLSTTQTFFQNAKKTEAWIGELGYSNNNAKGDNSTYSKLETAATYMAPWVWDTTWTSRLSYFYGDYNKHTEGRKDNAATLSLGIRKPLSEKLTSTYSATYTNNASTRAASDYNKYLIMAAFSWTTDL